MKLFAALVTSLALLTTQAQAQNQAGVEKQFLSWLVQTIWPKARSKGVSRSTLNAAFFGVTLNWKLPDLVPLGAKAEVPKQQRQAEFGSPKDPICLHSHIVGKSARHRVI